MNPFFIGPRFDKCGLQKNKERDILDIFSDLCTTNFF